MRIISIFYSAIISVFLSLPAYAQVDTAESARIELSDAVPANAFANLDVAVVKRLSASDLKQKSEGDFEIAGVRAIKETFGKKEARFRTRLLYYGSTTFSTDTEMVWFNAGDSDDQKFRVGFKDNTVLQKAEPGDMILLARYGDNEVLGIVTPGASKQEGRLFSLFGIENPIQQYGYQVNKEQLRKSPLAKAITEQLQQTGKIPVDVSIWKDVGSGEFTVEGKVEKVKDGDTLNIAGIFDIRLFGIDAPEHKQTCTRSGQVWECGQDAAAVLTKNALGKEAVCVNKKKEKYGRFLSVCKIGDLNLNELMVREGLAVIYFSDEFSKAESEARATSRGLWGSEFVNPEDFRRNH